MIIGTLVALGVLVTFHEFGHFWVARRCGVKVLRFSIGFGTPLLRWHDRQGTEFVIAAVPLGAMSRCSTSARRFLGAARADLQSSGRRPAHRHRCGRPDCQLSPGFAVLLAAGLAWQPAAAAGHWRRGGG
ncbi:site-2 protease family protein [Azotobacter chroococcum]